MQAKRKAKVNAKVRRQGESEEVVDDGGAKGMGEGVRGNRSVAVSSSALLCG